jgi:hypothetical protein
MQGLPDLRFHPSFVGFNHCILSAKYIKFCVSISCIGGSQIEFTFLFRVCINCMVYCEKKNDLWKRVAELTRALIC